MPPDKARRFPALQGLGRPSAPVAAVRPHSRAQRSGAGLGAGGGQRLCFAHHTGAGVQTQRAEMRTERQKIDTSYFN